MLAAEPMPQLTIQQALVLALQHHQAGRLGEAGMIYRQILSGVPENAEALHGLGLIAWQSNQKSVAIDLIGRAVVLRPQWPEALSNLGVALREVGRTQEAIDVIRRANSLNPNLPGARHNLANALNDLGYALTKKGRLEEAVLSCREAIMLTPEYAEAHVNLGIALKALGRFDEAISAYRQAIALREDMQEARNNLGNVLMEKQDFAAAIQLFREVVASRPEMYEARNNLGNALKGNSQLDEAIGVFREAIALQPKLYEAHCNMGNTLLEAGEFQEAIGQYRQAMALEPNQASVGSNLLYALHLRADYDAAAIAEEHLRWGHRHGGPLRASIKSHPNDPHPGRRLRIGYVSADFRAHAVGAFLLPLLRERDRSQVEVFCYSATLRQDVMTEQHRLHADQWREIAGVDDEQAAEQIRRDQIDVLIDLGGHTGGSRLLIFARKPAPVQVTYLAYPDTTGLSAIDYRFTDALADPPGVTERFHSETLYRLPWTNWCWSEPQDAPPVSEPPSLHRGWVTFGSFNYFGKVSEPMLRLWGRILRQTPGSRLLLKAAALRSAAVCRRVRETMAGEGIESSRIDLRGPEAARTDHLAMYREMDVALDTFPYHGTTTTCEALWMGVPVITLAGQTHVSRVGASLLNTIGLPELTAATTAQYVSLAVALASDPDRLSVLRRGMRERMRASPLMNARQFAGDVEAAYRQMWRTWCESASLRR
jgi:predicted O-linked N-acetylglucosamine transferase (SPINDLY family)